MPHCARCDAHVTEDYQRVFGTNDGDVHGCPECRAQTDMYRGAGADPEYEARSQSAQSDRRRLEVEA